MVFQFKTKYQGDKVFTGAKGDKDTQVSWYDDNGVFQKLTYNNEQVQHFIDNGTWIEVPAAPTWYFPGPGDGGKSVMPALYSLDLTPLEPTEYERSPSFGGMEFTQVWFDEAASVAINADLLRSATIQPDDFIRSVSVSEIREFAARTGYRVEVCEDFYTVRKEGLEDVYTVESLGGLIAVMDAIELLHNAVDRG